MNCLTIDFDIIMKPCINLYNDLVDDNWTLPAIEQNYPMLQYVLTPDLYIYEYLTRFLVKIFHVIPYEKIFFIREHDAIVPLVEGQPDLQICNIDHHHDVYYGSTTKHTRLVKPAVGNWVKYLKDKDVLKHYTWICNSNSTIDGDQGDYIDRTYELSQIDMLSLDDIDMVVICQSDEWISSLYRPLWSTWIAIAEEWYGQEITVI